MVVFDMSTPVPAAPAAKSGQTFAAYVGRFSFHRQLAG
jgi:hypothetical protein